MTSETNSSDFPLFRGHEHGMGAILQSLKIRIKVTEKATAVIFSHWLSGEKGNLY